MADRSCVLGPPDHRPDTDRGDRGSPADPSTLASARRSRPAPARLRHFPDRSDRDGGDGTAALGRCPTRLPVARRNQLPRAGTGVRTHVVGSPTPARADSVAPERSYAMALSRSTPSSSAVAKQDWPWGITSPGAARTSSSSTPASASGNRGIPDGTRCDCSARRTSPACRARDSSDLAGTSRRKMRWPTICGHTRPDLSFRCGCAGGSTNSVATPTAPLFVDRAAALPARQAARPSTWRGRGPPQPVGHRAAVFVPHGVVTGRRRQP